MVFVLNEEPDELLVLFHELSYLIEEEHVGLSEVLLNLRLDHEDLLNLPMQLV